jgi:hypothetical protein
MQLVHLGHLRSGGHERIHDFFAFVGTSVTMPDAG